MSANLMISWEVTVLKLLCYTQPQEGETEMQKRYYNGTSRPDGCLMGSYLEMI